MMVTVPESVFTADGILDEEEEDGGDCCVEEGGVEEEDWAVLDCDVLVGVVELEEGVG